MAMNERRRPAGFVNTETTLLLLLIAVGAAPILPTVLEWFRHEPVSSGGWAAFGAGILMIQVGVAPSMIRRPGDR